MTATTQTTCRYCHRPITRDMLVGWAVIAARGTVAYSQCEDRVRGTDHVPHVPHTVRESE